MAVQGGNLRLYIMTLVFTLIFPVLGYTFTNFPDEMITYDISLDAESLVRAGITLTDAETHNITWNRNGDIFYYTVGNKSLRIIWQDWGLVLGHGLAVQKPSWFGWWDPDFQWMISQSTGTRERIVANSTIVSEWDTAYNWTWFKSEDGLNVFVQPNNVSSNINTAVYTDAKLNVTLGYALSEESSFNFMQFVNWYMTLIIGGESFGLPGVFTWILRVVSAITLLSAILLAKDMIRL